MAENRQKGIVDLKVGEGRGAQLYQMRLDCNTMIEVQSALGIEDDAQAIRLLGRLRSFKAIRTIAYHGLKAASEGESLTEEEVGNIITEVGLMTVAEKIVQALEWAMPNEGDTPKGKARARSAGTQRS